MNLTLLIALALTTTTQTGADDASLESREDLGALFSARSVEGALWIENLSATKQFAWRPELRETGFLPASTYKILNSLIALETGAITDIDEVIPWDKVDRGWSEWNKDHSLRTAIRVSAVWFYQELARRIGAEAMAKHVRAAAYGNMDIGGKLDQFWLSGDLRISQRQQIELLKRLHAGTLPFKTAHQAAVKEALLVERTAQHVIRAKTGWAVATDPNVGWYVGIVEAKSDTWFFATYVAIADRDREQANARVPITNEALRLLGIVNEPKPGPAGADSDSDSNEQR